MWPVCPGQASVCPQILVQQAAAGGAGPAGVGRQGPKTTRNVGQGQNCCVVRILQIVECCGGGHAAEGACEAGRKLLQEPHREAWMISTNTDSRDGENKGGFEIF